MKPRTSLQRGRWHQRIATSALGALISLTAHGQATVDPDTQPFMTLAPYVLKSSNVEPRVGNPDGGTRAYRPWFENGAWTGDLIEYKILASGVRVVREDIGNYPLDGAGWRGEPNPELWSARYAFKDFVPYNPNDTTWQCVEEDAEYWKARNIFTVKSGARVSFLWNELSPGQRSALDPNTALEPDMDGVQYASNILNYVRGDRSLERCKENGQFRWRFSLLGSIVNSRPVYVPAGAGKDVVVVGANDGMLHGFSAANGTEVFAYVPSMILDRVGLIRQPGTRPGYLVDGELRHRDIVVDNSVRHIVAGGLGAGGKGLFVLNVSDPQVPDVIAEVAGANPGHIGGTWDDRLGYIHGRPTIARLPDGVGSSKWYVVSGNGYASTDGRAWLMLIPLEGTPTPVYIKADDTANNGLSPPSLVDATGNGIVDYAYAGDLQGNLWRFDLSTNSVRKVYAAGPDKPIVVEPDIARHPVTEDGFMIFFGTGSLLSGDDVSVTSEQSVFGLWDRPLNAAHNAWLPINTNRLVTQELKSANVTWNIPDGSCGAGTDTQALSTVRFVHDQQPLSWTTAQPNLGWQVHLPRDGERLIGHPQVRADRIQFITTNPFDMANPPDPEDYPPPPDETYANELAQSGSWMLQLDLATGGNALRTRALFDLNKDCTLSLADGAPPDSPTFDGTAIPVGRFPVGVNLGPFNIAQPAFARVRFDSGVGSVVDGVYINALYLPPQDPPDSVIHGPLDVTTDSPSGPYHQPLPEPVRPPFRDRLFPNASGPTKAYLGSDGLGHRVDGHSMGYNKHHGVDYVDLFNLEPRRGLYRLDVGAVYLDGTQYSPIVLDPNTANGLRVSQRELNRVEEVGIGENQQFIVMLTNADLSRGNRIRIGDRTWPVYAYQTMMMQHLRKPQDEMMAGLDKDRLVFTLRGDFNPICPPSLGPNPEDCSNRLRITSTERIGAMDATMGTMPGCVNNTDRYEGDLFSNNFVVTRKHRLQSGGNALPFLDANGNLIAPNTPEDLYADTKYNPANANLVDNPQSTRYWRKQNEEPWELGYRWRNGALTVQLLAVDAGNTPPIQLQESEHWPRPNPDARIQGQPNQAAEGLDIGWGGAYAKAFDVVDGRVVPLNNPGERFVGNSGMLYELSMFWHWGDMARFFTQGVGAPVVPICYGTQNYVPSLAWETNTFNSSDYRDLTAELEADDDLQDEYANLVAQVAAGTADAVAVLRLQQIISGSDNIRDYHRLRHYVPNNPKIEDRLLRIDRADWRVNVTVDGTPVEVIDVERDLLPSLGPNYQPGRRSWIDLVPE